MQSLGYERVFLRWPDEKAGPFVLEARWAEESGRPVCIGLMVWKGVVPEIDSSLCGRLNRSTPLDGIRGTDLRSIPLAQVLERLWALQQEREMDLRRGWTSVAESRPPDDPIRDVVAKMVASPSPYEGDGPKRRKADDREHFKAVAAVYAAAMAKPGRKRPTDAVSKHFNVSHSTATKWVHHARKVLHLLPPTDPGKPTWGDNANERKKGPR